MQLQQEAYYLLVVFASARLFAVRGRQQAAEVIRHGETHVRELNGPHWRVHSPLASRNDGRRRLAAAFQVPTSIRSLGKEWPFVHESQLIQCKQSHIERVGQKSNLSEFAVVMY